MILRGLTLWRPWAASIVHGPKRIENRPWCPPLALLREELWIAIHAGRKWDPAGAQFVRREWPASGITAWEREHDCPRRMREEGIVGVARVVRAVRVAGFDESLDGAGQKPWAFGPWCWVLGDVKALEQPIPVAGHQQLWALPLEIQAALEPLCVPA